MTHSRKIRLAMAQINVVVGDLENNTRKIVDWIGQAERAGADLVTFPELALTGYPPEDLLLKPGFISANLAALDVVAKAATDIVAVVGFVDRAHDIFNAAAILADGKRAGVYHKIFLPNYGVFDEFRYFQVGKLSTLLRIGESRVGVTICEDIWYPEGPVVEQAMGAGAELILNISSSPFHAGKRRWKERMLETRAADNNAIVAYNNLVGGQDELVFDGQSMIFDETGKMIVRGRQFEEQLIVADLDLETVFRRRLKDPRARQGSRHASTTEISLPSPRPAPVAIPDTGLADPLVADPLDDESEIYQALVLGTRDYVMKNGFSRVVIGLSGGIDSALTATVAVDALGSENVVGVLMPSRYSSVGSVQDSEALGRALGIDLITIPIADTMKAYESALAPSFEGVDPDLAEENLQARIRGNLVMALSNKFGWLVLSTGNKSEVSVGYCTLYGDMAGGFAVLKDVTKTMVYRLSAHCNRAAGTDRIPSAIIEKPPSAELRPDQKDSDSLPEYDDLDPILLAYVEEDQSIDDMIASGFDPDTVRRIVRMVDRAEYKRRQAAPGVKITPRAFGRDRRMPITNGYRG